MTPKPALRLVLSAGEASGDLLGADLARALKLQRPDIELAGVTGPRMRAAGVETWFDIDELSVMGLSEVIRHLPRLVRLRRALKARTLAWPAAAMVSIDAPDFHFGLDRQLKAQGLPAIHYVSPSVWAWRAGRIGKIARSVDLLLTLFPFEPPLYQAAGLKAQFVGHPLADELQAGPDKTGARAALGLDCSGPVIALLPGSRDGELARHLGLLEETARLLHQRLPHAQILLLLTGPRHQRMAAERLSGTSSSLPIHLLGDQTRLGLQAADVALAASGTVTLEAFLLECPLVVFYRLAPTTYHLARSLRLVRSEHVSLPNVLCQRSLVPERLQQAATPGQLLEDTLGWLNAPDRIKAYRQLAGDWRGQLALNAGTQAAKAILSQLGTRVDSDA